MRRSTPSVNASSAPTTSARLSPRSPAKLFRVPSRDANECDLVPHGDSRDQRLRAVAAGHPNDVGAVLDRLLGKLGEIVFGTEQERLDTALARFLRKLPTLAFPPPDFGLMISTPLCAARGCARFRKPATSPSLGLDAPHSAR